ncbi:heme peroxidase [Gymnopus androsaceus JB14]|uniref:Peroxidase n=1 Tax=Gymnopus androsaceus JB14 TaxID=1447944 RepID=A0A6A4I8N7_9AGAR|nr:heme peroxidase [Gymnopus androsaceus JB14]
MLQSLFLVACIYASSAHAFATFQWPNPLLRYADQQLYEAGLDQFVANCLAADNTTVSAQWLRIAYHDMSTHDEEDGTGGLDASIQYELDRPQNVGIGMPTSLLSFAVADTIALGAVLAVAACGGPIIPYSIGRIDATVAGPSTVPEPQQDLASHIASFHRQGFNQTEMIALVACGHTLGGVREEDFPLIVTEDLNLGETDQYLQNTTQNVLVVGPNVTTRSDFRIFSSDGNVTMQSLLSPNTFSETCADLIQRMINTVPSGVSLTDPIGPFNYILNPSTSPTVTMFWTDRQGSFCPSIGCSIQSSGTQTSLLSIISTAQARLSPISKFWFTVDNNDGSESVVVDNGGGGFVVEDDVISMFVDSLRSEEVLVLGASTSFDEFLKLVVAVSKHALLFADANDISATTFLPLSNTLDATPPLLPTLTTTTLQIDESNPSEGGFTFFTTNISTSVAFINLTANAGDATYTQINVDLTGIAFGAVVST